MMAPSGGQWRTTLHIYWSPFLWTALIVGPEFSWGEGPAVQGVKIINITFSNISGPAIYLADIENSNRSPSYEEMEITSSVPPATNTREDNRNILIEGNTFTNLGTYRQGIMGIRGLAISVQNATDVSILNNHFYSAPPHQRNAPDSIAISPTTTSRVTVR